MDDMDWEQGSPRRPEQQCPAMRPYTGRPPSQYYDPVHHASAGWYPHHRSTSASEASSWSTIPLNNPFAYQLNPGYPMNMNMPYSPFGGPPPMDNMHRQAPTQLAPSPHQLPNPFNPSTGSIYPDRAYTGMSAQPRGMHYPLHQHQPPTAPGASSLESSSHGVQELQARPQNSSHTIQFGTAPTFSSHQRASATLVPLRSRAPQAPPSDPRPPGLFDPPVAQPERQPEQRRRAPGSRRSRAFMTSRLYPPTTDGFGSGDGVPPQYLGRDDELEDLRVTQLLRGSIRTKQVVSSAAIRSLQSVPLSELEPHETTCVICYNDFGVETPEGLKEAPLRLPKCKHIFGDHCIKKWFEDSDSCPYCRDKLQSEPRITAGPHQEYVREMMRAQSRGMQAGTPSHLARALMGHTAGSTNRGYAHARSIALAQEHDAQTYALAQERRSPPTDNEESHRRQRPRHTSWGSGLTAQQLLQQQQQQQQQQQHQQRQNAVVRPEGISVASPEASTAEGQWLAGSHRAVTPPTIPSLPDGRSWTQRAVEPSRGGDWTGAPFESRPPYY